jgi:hypothetical protein
MGHKYKGIPGIYSHVTRPVIDAMLTRNAGPMGAVGSTIQDDHYPDPSVVKVACSHITLPAFGQHTNATFRPQVGP